MLRYMSFPFVFVSTLNKMYQTYYHWMIDPKLLKDTGTDPLTLEEVYEMESTSTATPNHYDQLSLGMQNTGERIMTVRC